MDAVQRLDVGGSLSFEREGLRYSPRVPMKVGALAVMPFDVLGCTRATLMEATSTSLADRSG